jgi:hypothetical protein
MPKENFTTNASQNSVSVPKNSRAIKELTEKLGVPIEYTPQKTSSYKTDVAKIRGQFEARPEASNTSAAVDQKIKKVSVADMRKQFESASKVRNAESTVSTSPESKSIKELINRFDKPALDASAKVKELISTFEKAAPTPKASINDAIKERVELYQTPSKASANDSGISSNISMPSGSSKLAMSAGISGACTPRDPRDGKIFANLREAAQKLAREPVINAPGGGLEQLRQAFELKPQEIGSAKGEVQIGSEMSFKDRLESLKDKGLDVGAAPKTLMSDVNAEACAQKQAAALN